MEVQCSACSKSYNVSEETLGKKAKCSCGETFLVTSPTEHEESGKNLIEEALKNEMGEEVKTTQKEEDLEIKPHFASYMFLGSPALIFLLIIFVIALFIASAVSMFVGGIGFILPAVVGVLLALGFAWRLVKYKKEKYTLTDRKIVYHYGNLISDNSVEIALDRVVQVKSTLGFIQYLLFKTGNIQIKTAGSSNSTVYFRNISTPVEVYEKIKLRMKKNGFHLEMKKLVQEERPHWLGIVGEVFGKFLWGMLVLAYIGYSFYAGFQEEGMDLSGLSSEMQGVSDGAVAGGIGFGAIAFIIFILTFLLKYLDLRQRKYQIFVDTIVYKEGFLTKHQSFIPMENISDTENTQSFFSKIFGLHDVVVSSSGNNNKVSFKNMVNGEKMMENIKYLKNETVLNENDVIEGEDEKTNSLIGFKNKTEMALNFDKEFKATYQMHFLKTILPALLLLVVPPVGIVLIIALVIQIKFTHFIVGESSIEKKYGFLNTKHNTFSVEKITGVVFKESLIDKLFNTCSITFWSIGNGADITFKNIKKVPDLEKNIKAKLGIQQNEVVKNIESQLTFPDYIKSAIGGFIIVVSLYVVIMMTLLIAFSKFEEQAGEAMTFGYAGVTGVFGLAIFLYILRFLYTKFYYSPVRYINKIYTDSIESIQGFFIVHKKYSLFRNVKGTKVKKYPLTSTGNLVFDIAGEQVHENKQQKGNGILLLINLLSGKGGAGSTIIVSNKISCKFIKEAFQVFEHNDEILNEETVETESVLTSTQDIGNSIVIYVIIAILSTVGINLLKNSSDIPQEASVILNSISGIIILLFAIIIGVIIWTIKVKFYDYQKDRVLFSSGIIYKQKHSILYKKFNYVEFNQGFINKIFRNGNIKIYTLGSGSIDMHIKDIDNYREVYELFKKD